MKLIDVHAHLDQIANIDAVLAEAAEAGVEAIVAVGVDFVSSQKNLELKKRIAAPKIYTAFGIHPGEIKPAEIDAALAFFEENIREACAIGEIGLDFWYAKVRKDEGKKNEQRQVFRRQLELAKKYDVPVVIHSRGAWAECLEMLKDSGPRRAVFHWYSGPVDVLKRILAKGFFISATPALAYSPEAREAVAGAPMEQTLIETDCPVFFREGDGEKGFQAAPRDVFRTLTIYSQLKGIDAGTAAQAFVAQAKKFFHME